jgi:pyruvyltransferase
MANSYNIKFCASNNFGDIANLYFIKKTTGKDPIIITDPNSTQLYYLFIGSIIHELYINKNAIICGAGIGSRNEKFDRPNKVIMVRGPITRQRFLELRFECPEVYGDPMLAFPKFYNPSISKKYKIGIIPHIIDTDIMRIKLKEINEKHKLNYRLIDLNVTANQVESVICDILECDYTISSSLHGLIASHAYNIPTMWLKTFRPLCGDNIKFHDYYAAYKINDVSDIKFEQLPLANQDDMINKIKQYPQPSGEQKEILVNNIINSVPFMSK